MSAEVRGLLSRAATKRHTATPNQRNAVLRSPKFPTLIDENEPKSADRGLRWAAQAPAIVHPAGPEVNPSAARRAQLIALALVSRSVAMRLSPRVRPRRPPQARRTRCAILRSTSGRFAR